MSESTTSETLKKRKSQDEVERPKMLKVEPEEGGSDKVPTPTQSDFLGKLSVVLGLGVLGGEGASQGQTMYFAPEDNVDRMNDERDKRQFNRTKKKRQPRKPVTNEPLVEIMFNGTDQVSEPRSYQGERPKQMLRWIATKIFGMYGSEAVEVQCYFDGTNVWVSSNTTTVNGKLRTLLPKGTDAFGVLGDAPGAKPADRSDRHAQKLAAAKDGPVPEEQKGIVAALKAGRINIPPDRTDQVEGFHAERRIEAAVGSLSPGMLGGVKRPCMICAYALGLDTDTTRAGPLWTTSAARGGLEIDDVLDHARSVGLKTFVTKSGGSLTVDYDTDSDDERDTKK